MCWSASIRCSYNGKCLVPGFWIHLWGETDGFKVLKNVRSGRGADVVYVDRGGGVDDHVLSPGVRPLHAHWDAHRGLFTPRWYDCKHTHTHTLFTQCVKNLLCIEKNLWTFVSLYWYNCDGILLDNVFSNETNKLCIVCWKYFKNNKYINVVAALKTTASRIIRKWIKNGSEAVVCFKLFLNVKTHFTLNVPATQVHHHNRNTCFSSHISRTFHGCVLVFYAVLFHRLLIICDCYCSYKSKWCQLYSLMCYFPVNWKCWWQMFSHAFILCLLIWETLGKFTWKCPLNIYGLNENRPMYEIDYA